MIKLKVNKREYKVIKVQDGRALIETNGGNISYNVHGDYDKLLNPFLKGIYEGLIILGETKDDAMNTVIDQLEQINKML